ncbi:MAG TPA: CBS domain-containing protein, partial [Xanthomonadaceae bacterium]|nr:CBS domain-containing protein [Xanthomonadaceae bacterium]
MDIRSIMTPNPACCTQGTTLQEAARLMMEHDCGQIPVLDGARQPVGVITDRDIATRGVAQG